MSRLATDLARALDPVQLCRVIGMEPDPVQCEVLRSTAPRLAMCMHRQAGKSLVASILAVHQAVWTPDSLVLLLSPSQRQSAELYMKVLTIYRALGRPLGAPTESATTLTMENGSRIASLPGSESTVRGYSGVALLCVDEAARVSDSLIASVRPMLAVSSGRLVTLSTPAGARGWWHDAWVNGGSTWQRFTSKAVDCPRISPEFLEEERRSLGDFFYRQEYECDFLSADTAAFDPEWLELLKECEAWNL